MDYGVQEMFKFQALELLGPILEDLFNYCSRRFSLKAVLLLADQLIQRVESIHSQGIPNRDIKASNCLMGFGISGHVVYLADLGLAAEHDIESYALKPMTMSDLT